MFSILLMILEFSKSAKTSILGNKLRKAINSTYSRIIVLLPGNKIQYFKYHTDFKKTV